MQLLEVDFVTLLNSLAKSSEPVSEVMVWADTCCERLMGGHRSNAIAGGVVEDRATLSSRSVLIRWGYVTSQIMRDLVRIHITLIVWKHLYELTLLQTIRSDPAFGAFQILKLFLE